MKIEVIEIGIQVIEVFTPGVQGVPGPQGPSGAPVVTATTDASITVTDQTYIIGVAVVPITIQLKDSEDPTTLPVEFLNAGSEDMTIRAQDGQVIFYNGQTDQEFTIRPGSGYAFVPKGTVQYAT